jgi:hypothetical protein
VTFEGRVSSVAAQQMEIATSEGPATFNWQGPALDIAFAVDEPVQVDVSSGPYALSPPKISIVRSERATAVAVNGGPWGSLRTESDASTTLGLEPTLPLLAYSTISCCASHFKYASGRDDYTCDRSALEARFEGSSTAIARGTTGIVGPWSVTNITASFTHSSEDFSSIQVTLLGPATPRSADGRLQDGGLSDGGLQDGGR